MCNRAAWSVRAAWRRVLSLAWNRFLSAKLADAPLMPAGRRGDSALYVVAAPVGTKAGRSIAHGTAALVAYGPREAYDEWRTANAGKFSFPVLFDPVGMPPRPPKASMEEMTLEEKKAFSTAGTSPSHNGNTTTR